MAQRAPELSLSVMVGNMCGTSLGMAPVQLVAQEARWVDLNGPVFLAHDRLGGEPEDSASSPVPAPVLWG